MAIYDEESCHLLLLVMATWSEPHGMGMWVADGDLAANYYLASFCDFWCCLWPLLASLYAHYSVFLFKVAQ